MLEYNKDKNILYAYVHPLARPNLQPEKLGRNIYESFLKYKNEQCKDDVLDIWLPALHDALKADDRKINIHRKDIDIHHIDPGHFNDRTEHVHVVFDMPNFTPTTMSHVTIMKLPKVHEDGTIEYDSKRYAFIHMLEQEPTISYEANEATQKPPTLKIKNKARAIWIDDDAKMLKIRFSDRKNRTSKVKYSLIDLITAMAIEEGYDVEEIWNEFANFSICNMFKDENEKTMHLYYSGANTSNVNADDYVKELVPRLTLQRIRENGLGDDSYQNTDIETNLCSLLSLDRAVGEILAKDVYSEVNPGEIVATAGQTIDNNLISVFKAEGVYKVYIKYIPNLEGYFLRERVFITSAKAGLRLTPDLASYFPDEHGMYLSKDYDMLPIPIIYEEGEILTSEMINAISALGIDSILISDKKTGGAIKILNFYEEIISNRKFLGEDIGKEYGVWYYMDKDRNFVKTKGAYTTYDFVALQSFCVKLFEGKWISYVTNADVGFRKILVPLSEQYHRAFRYATKEGFKQMNRKLKTIYQDDRIAYMNRDAIDNYMFPFADKFWKYLRDEAKCIIPLTGDNLHNPIAYASACTKVNVYTANKHSVADSQREISIGSFSKIDPYEIPQSGKMGTVYNSTCDVKIDEDGKMRSPYYEVRVINGVPHVITSKICYFTSEEEESKVIADICSLQLNEKNQITNPDELVLCRVPTAGSVEKQTFAYKRAKDVKYVNAIATQQLSWAASAIPDMSSNDAARAVFAVAQEKQAKGLVEAEEPIVMTSAYEQFVWLNDQFGLVARDDLTVHEIRYDPQNRKYLVFVHYDYQGPYKGDFDEEGDCLEIPAYFDSGYSVTKMHICVNPGQHLKKGEMIISSNFISENGILQFGRNALVGYQCDGLNYEDGTHMALSFCNALSSYRINQEEFTGSMRTTRHYWGVVEERTKYLQPGHDMIIAKYRDSNVDKGHRTITKNLRMHKAHGFFEAATPIKSDVSKANYGINIKAVSIDPFKGGDKASNRHGNKGVMSSTDHNVISDENMPRLLNGRNLDVLLNPMGTGSRMNIGQIKEIHKGLIGGVLNIKISSDAYNAMSLTEIREMMKFTVELMNSTGDPTPVFNRFRGMIDLFEDDLFEHCRANIDSIRTWAGCFDEYGTTRVILPYNDNKLTETRVLVGFIYVFKLIQESYKKLHARGNETMGEPYGELTDAPTHGSSKGGGQRFGTMEIDALCAYGVPSYIKELTNERCDNAIARTNLYVDTYLPPELRKIYHIDSPGQRRAVTQFLYTMLSMGIMCEPEDGEFLPLSVDNGTELAHWKNSTIRQASKHYKDDLMGTIDMAKPVERNRQEEIDNATKLLLGGEFMNF